MTKCGSGSRSAKAGWVCSFVVVGEFGNGEEQIADVVHIDMVFVVMVEALLYKGGVKDSKEWEVESPEVTSSCNSASAFWEGLKIPLQE